jgi:hypothetical protein
MKTNVSKITLITGVLFAVLFVLGASSLWADEIYLNANDLSSNAPDQVTLASVRSDGAGWVAIYNMTSDRKMGTVIGYASVHDGLNLDVTVPFDASQATPQLFAVLLADKSGAGKFEASAPILNSDGSAVLVVIPQPAYTPSTDSTPQ